jgi:hypothetical protein
MTHFQGIGPAGIKPGGHGRRTGRLSPHVFTGTTAPVTGQDGTDAKGRPLGRWHRTLQIAARDPTNTRTEIP